MKVSIITAVFNNRELLGDTIMSVSSQSYPNIEYIVIDGASTDGTIDVIKQYSRYISRWISEPDKGIYDAMNKGIRIAKGDIIGFLNSDDIYENEHVIGKIIGSFNKSNVDAVYGDLVYTSNDLTKTVRYWKAGEYSPGAFKKGWVPPHPTCFVKKSILDECGNFDTTLSISADFELLLRLIERYNIAITYIPQVLIKMRVGGLSNKNIKNLLKANWQKYKSFKKNNIKVSLTYFMYNALFKMKQTTFIEKNKKPL